MMGILEYDGEVIYYEVMGEGLEIVVLIYGVGGNYVIWF